MEKSMLKIWEKNGRKRGYLSEYAVEKALGRFSRGHKNAFERWFLKTS